MIWIFKKIVGIDSITYNYSRFKISCKLKTILHVEPLEWIALFSHTFFFFLIKCASFLSKLEMIQNLMIQKRKRIGINEIFLQRISTKLVQRCF